MIGNEFFLGIPDDIAAAAFSTPEWEPPFYWGLLRPLLYSALRGGITYWWGLRIQPGPGWFWMLTPETISSPGSAPRRTDSFAINYSNPETCYVIFFNFAGLYTSSDLHIERMIDAIWRAKYVERIGSGIQRMQRALEENGNSPMQLSATRFFVVRFFPRVGFLEAIQLTPRQTRLCQIFAARGTLTKSDVVTELGISGDTALREISKLMQAGVVEKLGVSRNTRYAWIRGRE